MEKPRTDFFSLTSGDLRSDLIFYERVHFNFEDTICRFANRETGWKSNFGSFVYLSRVLPQAPNF